MSNILEDCKIIELAGVLAGPSVGMFLAEVGARVLKIENPSTDGDVTRSWKLPSEDKESSLSSYFNSINWGKTCVSIDLTTEEGRNRVYDLLRDADIVLTSYKFGDAQKFNMSYEDIKKVNPTIIYASITGFGDADHRTAYDALIQAETGFMHLNREPDGIPAKMPVALMDILAAHQLEQLILLAWINKLKTGKGCSVEVSLYEAAVSSLANQAGSRLYAGVDPEPAGSEHPHIYPYGGLFKTGDDRYILPAIGTNKQFESFCSELGVPDLATDDRFKYNQLRSANRDSLRKLLLTAISQITDADSLIHTLHERGVPVGMVRTVGESIDAYAQNFDVHHDKNLTGIPIITGRINGKRVSKNLTAPEELDSGNSF